MFIFIFFVIIFFQWLCLTFSRIPANCLSVNIHYENILTLFGRKGHFCTTVEQILNAVKKAFMVIIFY